MLGAKEFHLVARLTGRPFSFTICAKSSKIYGVHPESNQWTESLRSHLSFHMRCLLGRVKLFLQAHGKMIKVAFLLMAYDLNCPCPKKDPLKDFPVLY